MFNPVNSFLPMFTLVYQCLLQLNRACLPMFTPVYLLAMVTTVKSFLPMFTTVYLCLPMFANA